MMQRPRIHKRMYAVSKDGVGLIAGTMAYSRRAAIACFMLNVVSPERRTWDRFKSAGYRTVMAQIKIIRRSSLVASQEQN